jgi:alanine racemase
MDEIADKLDTINYEIPCMISTRVPRIYMRNGEPKEVSNKLLSTGIHSQQENNNQLDE